MNDAADYIADLTTQLRTLAEERKLMFLAYLLAMAATEARRIAST